MDEENRNEYVFIPEIKIEDDEPIIEKIYSNAFWETDLEKVLNEKEIKFLILCGFAAENCVLFTYNGATERKFNPVILQNGILSSRNENILNTYLDRQIISYSAIQLMCDLIN